MNERKQRSGGLEETGGGRARHPPHLIYGQIGP